MRPIPALLLLAAVLPAATVPDFPRSADFRYHAPEGMESAPPDGTLRTWLERYSADRAQLERFFDAPYSQARLAALRSFYRTWLESTERIEFDRLSQDGKVDWLLFRNRLQQELRELDHEEKRSKEISGLIPFAASITALYEARQRIDSIDPARAASELNKILKQVRELSAQLPAAASRTSANRASKAVLSLRETLRRWHAFYNSYDPAFTWWTAEPYRQLDTALEEYSALIREKLAGVSEDDRTTILGDPIGREALLADLASEMIPYTPDELIEIANREFAWCQEEMRKASRELGFGDDWRKALEHVKTLHVEPGKQPLLVRNLAMEAIDYVEKHGLVTVPPLVRDTWRMEMMSPERQKFAPFFLGGEAILVAYPTSGMTHEEKMMSMRGNNVHFARATVFHELIPGHNLQQFMTSRYRTYREPFATPFWTEGWALYWEMLLWDRGFARGPEDRIGMLFWRMHRCSRIIFSLNFHLGKMTAAECVQFLIEKGGQEPENAAAEVRRSFEGDYGPLYQIAYMLGALQFRELNRELVGTGKMTLREFHDRILQLNSMPVEMVRASLTGQPLTRNFRSGWRFYPGLR